MSDPAAVRLCSTCDSPLPAGALFCISCGTRINTATTNLRAASADHAPANPYPPVIEINQRGEVSSAPLSPLPAAPPSYQQPGYPPQPYQQPVPPYQQPGYPVQSYQQPVPPYQQPGYPVQSYQQPPNYPVQSYPQQPGYPAQPYPQQPGYPAQPYPQQPGYPAYGQQINVVVTTGNSQAAPPAPPPVNTVLRVPGRKSVLLAFVLALLFGPFAYFYVQSAGKAFVNLAVTFVMTAITAGAWLGFYWLISLLVVPIMANSANNRIIVVR